MNWTRVLTSFLLWPVFAVTFIAGRVFNTEAQRKAQFQNRVEDLRFDFEQVTFSGESIASLFEFRETFYRFVGLSEAADEVQAGRSTAEIFEISGHNNKLLASRCLARKNLSRLSYHRSAARQEFIGLISRLTVTGADRIELTTLASELADHLHDQIAADAFQGMISVPPTRDGDRISGLEKEVWRSRTPSTSTIS